MTRSGADTAGLVEYLITSLVDDPDSVTVERTEDDGVLRFSVTVAADDVGKVIGRNGRIIKAIRTLVRASGSTEGQHVEVDIVG